MDEKENITPENKEKRVIGKPFVKGDDPRREGNGRKKGRSMRKLFKTFLKRVVDIDNPFTDEGERLTVKEALALRMMYDAFSSSTDAIDRHRAFKMIMEYTDPVSKQIDHTTKGEKIGGGIEGLPIEKQIAILKIMESENDATTENNG